MGGEGSGGDAQLTLELLITSRATGKIFEVSRSVIEATYTTNRTGSPGTFRFSILKAGDLSFLEGDTVRFSVDGTMIFFGWVFDKNKDKHGRIDVICYDRLRYCKASASYAFYDQPAEAIIAQIAGDLQLTTGALDTTGYAIPSLIYEETGCLDIIGHAVQQTTLGTGRIYVFYDDGTGLALRKAASMVSDVIIGERSLLLDYAYKTSIDTQTYNEIKLARPNEATGMADTFIARDSTTIGEWGLLRHYQRVDSALNDAQVQAQAEAMLGYYNRRLRTLRVEALGVVGLRAGMLVMMIVPGLGDINLEQYVMIEKITHTWSGGGHTMSFDTMAI